MRTGVVAPNQFSSTDGWPVVVRTTRQGDVARVRDFVAGLSLRSQLMRFFTSLPHPPDGMMRALVTVDKRRNALVALHEGEVVGHAMSFLRASGDVEIAVVVADGWQGIGLGRHLVASLVRQAAADGATTVRMDVLRENREVLAMVARLWPEARTRIESGSVVITAPVPCLDEVSRAVDVRWS